MKEEVIHVERIYEGRLISLRIDHVRFVSGRKTKREIVEHPGAAAILAFTKEGKVVLIKQYRRAIDRVVYEIPAGKLEAGEDIRDTAVRELEEEAGYKAGEVRKLFDAFSTPGYCSEMIGYYLATDIEKTKQCCDPDEFIEVEPVTLEQALEMIKTNKIVDNKTIAALLYYKTFIK